MIGGSGAGVRGRGTIGRAARVAFQGEPGAFSEDAIAAFFSAVPVSHMPRREFRDVRRAVLSGEADYGVLPVENSIHGSVVAATDVLTGGGLEIVREVVCPIHLHLLAPHGATLAQLRSVLSHPVALGQCRRFLAAMPRLQPVPFYDTAGAAREVALRGGTDAAAVASRAAAERYGLAVLASGIEDRSDNRTRFVLVTAREEEHVESIRQ